jgi:putative PIN family toxin of toxin-antitoxin system
LNLVIDTNVLLDLWVFDDPRAVGLHAALQDPATHWLATAPMREELRRVLAYPHIVRRLQQRGLTAEEVLADFDARATLCPLAPKAPVTCKDPDDQKFIDLGVQHQALLLSKDKAVLCMKKRLESLYCQPRTAI